MSLTHRRIVKAVAVTISRTLLLTSILILQLISTSFSYDHRLEDAIDNAEKLERRARNRYNETGEYEDLKSKREAKEVLEELERIKRDSND